MIKYLSIIYSYYKLFCYEKIRFWNKYPFLTHKKSVIIIFFCNSSDVQAYFKE